MKVSDVVVDGDVEMPDKTSPVETEAVDETENEGGESLGEHSDDEIAQSSVNKGTDDLKLQVEDKEERHSIFGFYLFQEKLANNQKLKRMFEFDALKAPVFDPNSHNNTTLGYTVFFYISVLAYTSFAMINFANRPEQTSFTLRESKQLPTQYLRVDFRCSTPWGCLRNSSKLINQATGLTEWRWDASPSISATYSDDEEDNVGNNMRKIDVEGKFTSKNISRIPLKFSNLDGDGIIINVPGYQTTNVSNCIYGSTCMPILKLNIRANNPKTNGPMQIKMDLEPFQRKAIYIGVLVRENSNSLIESSYELFVKDLFYVGKNSENTATLEIKMAQFAQVFKTHRPGTIPDLFSDIGGFSGIALSICGLLCSMHMFFFYEIPEKIENSRKRPDNGKKSA